MYDASCAAPSRPFPLAMVTGFAVAITLGLLMIMNYTMMLAPDATLPTLGAIMAAVSAAAFGVHLRAKAFDMVLIPVFAALLGYACVTLSTQLRDDSEIDLKRYSYISATLRERAELAPLIARARADRVITNAEYVRFGDDVQAFDRAKVLAE